MKLELLKRSLTKEINGRKCQSSVSIRDQIFWAHNAAVIGRVVIGEWVGKFFDYWGKYTKNCF